MVATGPALSPFGDEAVGWMMNYYDAFNRVVATGWAPASGSPMTTAMRKTLQDSNNGAVTNIARSADNYDGATINYLLTGNVATGFELLTLTYYDNYTWLTGVTPPSTIQSQPRLADVKGLVTGGWTRIVTTSTDNYHDLSYSFYDNKGRVLRARTNNTQLGGYSQTETNYDFDGDVAYTITRHKRVAADTEIIVREDFSYTPQDRLLIHTHKINSLSSEMLSLNSYNELGEHTFKASGGSPVTPLQRIDYKYNIRGWLTDINNTGNLQKESDPLDLFAFKINYDTAPANSIGLQVQALYNGNIAETSWRTASDNIERRYGYTYDQLNRLTNAWYQIPYASVPIRNSYNEELSYDKNGNIMSLNRNGGLDGPTTVVQIDELLYTYDSTKKNQLMKVVDGSNSTQGFSNGASGANDDYSYDSFGNMTSDKNKGITSIKYNHLNLPVEIKFNNSDTKKINYIYNAAGVKLKKTVTDGATVTTTDYLNGFQYVNTVLEFFPTAEGYVKNTVVGSTNNYNYVYHYKDHLGNVRVSYTVDPADSVLKILEENHYYPFGLKHESYSATQQMIRGTPGGGITIVPVTGPNDLTYNYRYNGKEQQTELGLNMYDYGARNYDAAIGRWMNIDPLAEKFKNVSPYNYCIGNPIIFVDPDGKDVQTYTGQAAIDVYNSILSQLGNDGWITKTGADGKKTHTYRADINSCEEAETAGIDADNVWASMQITATDGSYSYNLNADGSVTNALWGDVAVTLNPVDETFSAHYVVTSYGTTIITPVNWSPLMAKDNGAITQMDFSSPFFSWGWAAQGLGYLGKAAFGSGRASSGSAIADDAIYSVYQGVDKSGTLRYVGITSRDPAIRFAEHLNSLTNRSSLQYRVVNGANGMTKTQARVFEQRMINANGLQKNGGALYNKINSISKKYWLEHGITP